MKALHKLAFVLVIVGALNWGLVAFDYNLVTYLLGTWPMAVKTVYVLVALSAVCLLVCKSGYCKHCAEGKMSQ